MEKDRFYFRVGLFMVLLIFGAISTLGWFATQGDKQHHITYAIYFEGSVDGLEIGSPITLKGIEVGHVIEIDFASYENDLIRVLVDIVDTAPIRKDSIATMTIQGITGTSNISLDNEGREETEYLVRAEDEDYLVIQSRPSSLEQLFATLPEVLGELKGLSNQVKKLLSDENVGLVNSSLKNFDGTLKTFDGTMRSINSSARNVGSLFNNKNDKALGQIFLELNQALIEGKITLREIKMLARTLREDPSIIIHGEKHKGTKLP